MKSMNKTYKIQLPRNKEAQNIRTNIKNGTIEVEVELKEWKPRDGDICFVESVDGYKSTFIFKSGAYRTSYYVSDCCISPDEIGDMVVSDYGIKVLRPATDSEKQLLFDALANEGKMWDAQKKAVVDLPKQAVEPPRRGWEPKDGDVCFISAKRNHLFVFRKFENDVIKSYFHIAVLTDDEISKDVCNINEIEEFRPATDLEKMHFFDYMAKKGKAWDAENRKVVDYPMWDTKKGGKDESEN